MFNAQLALLIYQYFKFSVDHQYKKFRIHSCVSVNFDYVYTRYRTFPDTFHNCAGRHKICMDIQAVLGSQEMQKIFPFPAFHNPIKLKKNLRTNDHKPWAYIVDPQINPEYSRLQGQVIFVWSVQRRVMTVKANPVCEM